MTFTGADFNPFVKICLVFTGSPQQSLERGVLGATGSIGGH